MRKAALAVLLLLAAQAIAQDPDPDDYNRYLVPLSTREVPGANGSIWRAEWIVHNFLFRHSELIFNHCPPNVSPCPSPVMPALTTTRPILVTRGDGTEGGFVYVLKEDDPLIGMSLRVRDLSRNAQNFGTDIPIVAAEDYTSTARPAIYLLDIPTDPKYRATLRIYGPDQAPTRVQVSVYPEDSSSFIEQYFVDLQGIVTVAPVPFPVNPSYAQLDPLTPSVRASGERVRIIVYSQPGVVPTTVFPIWAFLSITNNENQQVTTVTPAR